MNKELEEILKAAKNMSSFLEDYSIGNINLQAKELKKRIEKYIKDEKEYGEGFNSGHLSGKDNLLSGNENQ